jgi:hypothetical protein
VIRRTLLSLLLICCYGGPGLLRAELTESQKKELIRKQHKGSSTAPARQKGNTGPAGSAKKKKPAHHGSSSGGGKAGSSPKKKSSPTHHDAAHQAPAATSGQPADHVPAVPQSPANPVPPPPPGMAIVSTTVPLPHGAEPSAPITIEKSGVEPDQGFEPVPTTEQAPQGFWGRLFGPRKTYRYLSPSVRHAIDHAPVKHGRWKYIVVHNSGTREGNARVFDVYHRRVRHMVNGLAYHFVIGDGHGSGDGQIEIGDRWRRQINGGHVASDYLNDIALGICLVGDFNRDQPTPAQAAALEELVPYLRDRVGRSQGRRAIVHAHKEINPRPTDCPGDRFPYGWLHAKFGNER